MRGREGGKGGGKDQRRGTGEGVRERRGGASRQAERGQMFKHFGKVQHIVTIIGSDTFFCPNLG